MLIFSKLNIETISSCNRKCEFCPTGRGMLKDKTIMKMSLVDKICHELKALNFKGKIGFQMRNEPLLDKRLPKIIKKIRKNCPSSYLFLSTNGDLINKDLLVSLYDAGLNGCGIQLYESNDRAKFENTIRTSIDAVKGLRFERRTSIGFFRKKFIWINDKTSWKEGKGDFTNRAGTIKRVQIFDQNKDRRICKLPMNTMLIMANGNVPLCCNDWFAKVNMGNIYQDSLINVWEGEKFNFYREKLQKENYNIPLCKDCDY